MAKRNNKRRDPMIGLIIMAVLFAVLAVGAWFVAGQVKDYRADVLAEKQQEVRDRNNEKKAAYEEEKEAYINKHNASSTEVNEAWPEAASEGWDVIDLTNYPLEIPGTVTVTRDSAMFGGLLLVNEWHSRPADYDESQIVTIHTYAKDSGLESFWDDGTCKLHPVALDALIEMLLDAKELGYDRYVVRKGYNYRSYADQEALFNEELAYQRERRSNLSEEELVARARAKVNYPGTSEFNSGLSFALKLYEKEDEALKEYYSDTPFYDTADGQWLLENAWKYGFVFRFPVDGFPTADTVNKAYKTGMNQSLNCYRYVGKGHAAAMNTLGLCLEEYIEYLQEHPHIAVFEDGVKRYEITYQYVGDDVATFTVEINQRTKNYTISLDNMGGVITVYEYDSN